MKTEELRAAVHAFPEWHYEIELPGVRTPVRHRENVMRHERRRRLFFDPLVQACGGSLRGRRVLDLGCNAGYWSLLAVEHGADFVLGIDARRMHVDQASLVFEAKEIARDRYRFVEGDVLTVDLEGDARFDIVLLLGLLYHVSAPVELLRRAAAWSADLLVVDTTLSLAPGASFTIRHDPLDDPRSAAHDGLVLHPSRGAVTTVLEDVGLDVVTLRPRFSNHRSMLDYRRGTRRAFVASRATDLSAFDREPDTLARRGVEAVLWAVGKPVARALRRRPR
jgi:tRNA (mo5U34)-methyltransferase